MYSDLPEFNVTDTLRSSETPVLLACLSPDYNHAAQLAVLRNVSRRFPDCLTVFKVEGPGLAKVKRMFQIGGTPTFLCFVGGREKARLLGHVQEETLTSFIAQSLSQENGAGDDGHELNGLQLATDPAWDTPAEPGQS